MSVHQLKDGRWIVKHAKGSNPADPERTREYFGRGPEAQEAAVRRNEELGLASKAAGGTLFHILAEQYVEARQASQAASTRRNDFYKLAERILPAMGRLPWTEITPARLDRYVGERSRTVKSATIHRELTIVRAIIRWAVRRREIPYNPIENYEFPKKDIAIFVPPTSAELAAVYAVAPPHLQRVLMLAYYTGMRPGPAELFALRWEQVDLDGGTIFVRSAKKGGMRARIVPITSGLDALLRKWMEEDREIGELGYVINYRGSQVSQVNKSWQRAKAAAGISRRLRLYDLRHMAATAMLAAGADLKSVSEILGHSSPEITMSVYQHTSTALRRDAVSRLTDPLVTGYQGDQEK